MNPWKALIVKHKAKSVKPIPEGWLTRAQVAEKIGCAESRVNENLRAALKAKEVLAEKFPVWDAIEGKVVSVQCYRINDRKGAQSASPKKLKWPFPEGTRVRRKDGGAGVMLAEGRVRWDTGTVTQPKARTVEKIIPV